MKQQCFKLVKYDNTMRSSNPELYRMAMDNIAYDQFLMPKDRYLEKLKRQHEMESGPKEITLHMSTKLNNEFSTSNNQAS